MFEISLYSGNKQQRLDRDVMRPYIWVEALPSPAKILLFFLKQLEVWEGEEVVILNKEWEKVEDKSSLYFLLDGSTYEIRAKEESKIKLPPIEAYLTETSREIRNIAKKSLNT